MNISPESTYTRHGNGHFTIHHRPYTRLWEVVMLFEYNKVGVWQVSATVYHTPGVPFGSYDRKAVYGFGTINLTFSFGACGAPTWPDDAPEDYIRNNGDEWIWGDFGDPDMYGELDMLRVALGLVSDTLGSKEPCKDDTFYTELLESGWLVEHTDKVQGVLASALEIVTYSLPEYE